MSAIGSFIVWSLSFLVFFLILYISYKVSYRLGIKKALYRTSYILLSVIFAFILTPTLNRKLFHYDLRKIDMVLNYKGVEFYTLIDYIEEVIAHNEFLNDIYAYVPSLKDLFMDFPEVVLAPITYVVLFFVFLIIWMPLYLYLSYKRKRRILYDREDNKTHRVWAGLLGCVQCIFVFSTVLTPVNGFNRIYQDSINETLDKEYDSICEENEILSQYSKICDTISIYDSSVLADLGGKGGFNNFVFDSITRISYDGKYTNISKEASLMIKGTIVLDQSGLLDVLYSDTEIIPTSLIVNNTLSDEDIDVIANTLSESKYSEEVLLELGDLVTNTLNSLLSDIFNYQDLTLDYSMSREKVVSEIKVILRAIKMLSGTTLLDQIFEIADKIKNFVETVPEYKIDEFVVFDFILDLVNGADLDELETLVEYLFESSTFNKVLPYILDSVFYDAGFRFVATNGDVLDQFYNFMDFARIVKKYQMNDPLKLVASLDDEDAILAAEVFQYMANCAETKGFVDFIFGEAFQDFEYYSMSELYAIPNWANEAFLIRDFCGVMYDIVRETGQINYEKIRNLLENDESPFVQMLIGFFRRNLIDILDTALKGGFEK